MFIFPFLKYFLVYWGKNIPTVFPMSFIRYFILLISQIKKPLGGILASSLNEHINSTCKFSHRPFKIDSESDHSSQPPLPVTWPLSLIYIIKMASWWVFFLLSSFGGSNNDPVKTQIRACSSLATVNYNTISVYKTNKQTKHKKTKTKQKQIQTNQQKKPWYLNNGLTFPIWAYPISLSEYFIYPPSSLPPSVISSNTGFLVHFHSGWCIPTLGTLHIVFWFFKNLF